MQDRHARSGASGRAPANKTLKGPANGTLPWQPPLAPRRVVPAPPPPTARPAVTLKQGFGVPDEEDGATRIYGRAPHDSSFPTARGPQAQAFWGSASQEPSATGNVTLDELEELRTKLQMDGGRKSSRESARDTDPGLTGYVRRVPHSRSRRSTLVTWLASAAVLTGVGVGVAHQKGYLSQFDVSQFDVSRFDVSRFDVSRLDVSRLDVQPLLSALGSAQASLRTEYDKLFVKRENRTLPSLPPAPVPLSAQPPIPVVEQLQESEQLEEADLQDQVDQARLTSNLEPSAEGPESTANDLSALIYPRTRWEAEVPGTADSEAESTASR